ncbi:MAG: DUF4363 family protein [Clostridia bacterium]|nr:DUF4363 family protein [Clostridia bacterium]
MKRLIAAAILFIFVVASYLTGFAFINNTYKSANELLEKCINIYESDKSAYNATKNLKNFWDKKEGLLSVFANHSSIDDIELAISSMLVYSDTKNNEIFYEYSSTVKTLLHQLLEDSKPNMHSIS